MGTTGNFLVYTLLSFSFILGSSTDEQIADNKVSGSTTSLGSHRAAGSKSMFFPAVEDLGSGFPAALEAYSAHQDNPRQLEIFDDLTTTEIVVIGGAILLAVFLIPSLLVGGGSGLFLLYSTRARAENFVNSNALNSVDQSVFAPQLTNALSPNSAPSLVFNPGILPNVAEEDPETLGTDGSLGEGSLNSLSQTGGFNGLHEEFLISEDEVGPFHEDDPPVAENSVGEAQLTGNSGYVPVEELIEDGIEQLFDNSANLPDPTKGPPPIGVMMPSDMIKPMKFKGPTKAMKVKEQKKTIKPALSTMPTKKPTQKPHSQSKPPANKKPTSYKVRPVEANTIPLPLNPSIVDQAISLLPTYVISPARILPLLRRIGRSVPFKYEHASAPFEKKLLQVR